jgi:ribosome-associated translation inhibitor RaiA/DNA-directed RNA polymerase specialized sigma24 family protein
MKYAIHHLDSIEPASLQKQFEEEVQKKTKRLEKFLTRYPRPLKLHIHVKRDGNDYSIAATLPMQARILTSREKGTQSLVVLHAALERLRKQAKLQVHTERRDYLLKKRERLAYITHSGLDDLQATKQDNDPDYFIFYLKTLLPDLEQYINVSASKIQAFQPLFKENKIHIYNLRKEVYLRLYKQFEQLTSNEKLHLWAISAIDKILQQLATKYQYKFFIRETDYSGNGALKDPDSKASDEMPEEQFFNPRHYNPEELLHDAGADEAIIEKAEDGLFNEQLKQWLHELDGWHTSIFYLYYQMRLNIPEIARIKQKTATEIKNTLNDLRTSLLAYFQ